MSAKRRDGKKSVWTALGEALTGGARRNVTPNVDDYALQYIQPGHRGECELVIGLDFGTSSTKVVIQAPDLPGRPAYAVDFGPLAHPRIPYLMPTVLSVLPDSGVCCLGRRDEGTSVQDMKVELLLPRVRTRRSSGPTRLEIPPEEAAACYLGLILRHGREWFLATKHDLFRDFSRLRWSVNMGVPSPCIEDNDQNRVFQRVGRVAWMLSTLPTDLVTLARAKNELVQAEGQDYWEGDDACEFAIIPEIAAGAVGYARSDHRRDGLHVMIDVGASTVDACSFTLGAPDGNDLYSLLIADVKRLGAVGLFYNQLSAVVDAYEKHTELLRDRFDPLYPMPEIGSSYALSSRDFDVAVKEAQERFLMDLRFMLRRVIWQTRMRRDPGARVWKSGKLPVLLIGGGSRLKLFRSAIDELDQWLCHFSKNQGVDIMRPPLPAMMTDPQSDPDEGLFLAVAWGLSHRELDIGDMIPADRIDDVPPLPKVDVEREYISRYGL